MTTPANTESTPEPTKAEAKAAKKAAAEGGFVDPTRAAFEQSEKDIKADKS